MSRQQIHVYTIMPGSTVRVAVHQIMGWVPLVWHCVVLITFLAVSSGSDDSDQDRVSEPLCYVDIPIQFLCLVYWLIFYSSIQGLLDQNTETPTASTALMTSFHIVACVIIIMRVRRKISKAVAIAATVVSLVLLLYRAFTFVLEFVGSYQ